MLLKDYFILTISFIALAVSLYNFFVQHLRKRERLIGSMISVGINEGKWDRKMEYSVCNVGDVQLVVKEVDFTTNGKLLELEVIGIPIILKPGEIALFDILYNSAYIEKDSTETVELGVFSALGKGYRLPHIHRNNGNQVKEMWDVFELKIEHEGF